MKPDLDTELGRWLYALQFVGYREDQRMGILLENNPNLTELAERYKKFDANREARQAYEDRVKYLRDQANLLYTAEVEGRAKGMEEGQRQAQLDIARRLKASGLSVTAIAQATGLPVEEVL